MPIPRFATTTFLLRQTSLALSAAVIYDGGRPDGDNGSRLTSDVSAQQSTLATLQGLMFFGSANSNNLPSQFSGEPSPTESFWTTRVRPGRVRLWEATRRFNGSTT
jgi:hypothetical protein